MDPHHFEEAGVAYEVQFHQMRGRWVASLRGHASQRPVLLHPLPGETAGPMSDEARRAGFIAVARWLVITGRHAARVAAADGQAPTSAAGRVSASAATRRALNTAAT
jgi:hypothetical protein